VKFDGEKLYQVFGKYRFSTPLGVCRCPSCVGPETEKALLSTSLRKMPASLLSEFTNSAHGKGKPEDLKYLLPRYFELWAEGIPTSHIGMEMSSTPLENSDWENWNEDESNAVATGLKQLFLDSLEEETPLGKIPLETVLVMLSVARAPLASWILEIIPRASKVQCARLGSLAEAIQGDSFADPFWSLRNKSGREIRQALSSSPVLEKFMEVLSQAERPDLNAQIESAFHQFA